MSDDENKPKLPGGADTLIPLGSCDKTGQEHVLALKDGEPVAMSHMIRVGDGKPLPQNADLFYVDPKTGAVKDSLRLGAGSGPSQVATPKYRSNWDGIFGKKPAVQDLN